ncbi:MAG: 4a-hydroxytetrahydrobiopterin dehydratase [Chloroflexi bacterium]|nr:4a-hydroxytetrahydrobiopterin dehydratase [Chloroflexota bacterium]MCC6893343.1 4a-hydroxytetrahydrobiopterin dehydratase [Anaerolineae bacterium]
MATATKTKSKKSKSEAKKPAAREAMTEEAVKKGLKKLDGWAHKNDMLEKTFAFDSYLAGVAFAATVGTLAEGFDHHPDMLVKWRKVTVSFTTHDADSKVTQTDFKIAAAIDALPYPPKG